MDFTLLESSSISVGKIDDLISDSILDTSVKTSEETSDDIDLE